MIYKTEIGNLGIVPLSEGSIGDIWSESKLQLGLSFNLTGVVWLCFSGYKIWSGWLWS